VPNLAGGIRYEFKERGSFVRQGFTMNHILSYRDTYTKFGLPRDVMKIIDRDIKSVEDYISSSKRGEFDDNVRTNFFKVIREYYTPKRDSPGERPASRFAPFLGDKNASMVLRDMKNLQKEIKNPKNVPEFDD
jgi:hypothetical protein